MGTIVKKKPKKNEYAWNVIKADEFDVKLRTVFEMVSDAIITTLGPYGSQVILDQFGESHITKDGWSVLKKLRFQDKDMVLNSILNLIHGIAGPVVATVGDGSSTSIALSHFLYMMISKNPAISKLRPKDRQDLIKKCCETLAEDIQKKAIQVDRDGDLREIYKLAHVSTNGNDAVAKMIKDIYVETKNPTIQFKEAKGSETSVEIIEGYKGTIYLRDSIFVNNDQADACVINKPMIMMFDHRVDRDIYTGIIEKARDKARSLNRRLVVIAPYYSRAFDMRAKYEVSMLVKMHGVSDVVYAAASVSGDILANEYSDFAMMAGCSMFTELDYERFKEREDALYESTVDESKPLDPKYKEDIPIDEFIGEVENISIGFRDTTITGLFKRNNELYNIHYRDAKNKYESLRDRNRALNVIDIKENDLKQRLSKLSGKMGTIYVGGNTGVERHANYDLVEDAVRAAESAYVYGYNVGGSLAVVRACLDKIGNAVELEDLVHGFIEGPDSDDPEVNAYFAIMIAAVKTYKAVLKNKFGDDEDDIANKIILDSIKKETVYNLITDEFDGDIINSCKTDIEILKAASSIVSLLLSSSIFVSINPEIQ